MMNDFFHEHLYKRRKRPVDWFLYILIVLVTDVLAAAIFVFSRAYIEGFGRLIGPIGAFGVVYVAYRILMRFSVEFELSYLNGEIDVDKILGQASRKRVITLPVKKFDSFGIFSPQIAEELTQRHFDAQIDARSFDKNATVYYATLKHPRKGLLLVVFEPDNIMVEQIKKDMNPVYFRRSES